MVAVPQPEMSKTNTKMFEHILQNSIQLDDREWSYRVPRLPPPSTANPQQLVKSIILVGNTTKQHILLRLQTISLNRAIAADLLDRFILISFADFRLRVCPSTRLDGDSRSNAQAATARECADYITRLLRSGTTLNGVHYNFYGHSNSQLKSRTCFLYAASKTDIS
jgi:RNA dependent RNA polymerase